MTKKQKIIISIVIIVLVTAAIVLAVMLSQNVKGKNKANERIDGMYESAYYDAIDSLKNVETKLSKVSVLTGKNVRRELLADVWKGCDIAVTNLTKIGRDDENVESATKFLNQTGDYAHYLMGKVSSGESLTQTEKENVKTFKRLVTQLLSDLSVVGEGTVVGEKISAKTISDFSAVGEAIKTYSSIDYPELIYDGPFSDGLNDREAKFLKGKEEITAKQAEEKIKTIFPNATDVKKTGDNSSSIESFVVEYKIDDATYTAFVTKRGGFIAAINTFEETSDPRKTDGECVEEAKAFLQKIGYESMKDVWTYNNNSTVYVNFAYEEHGVVFYPDLIKVKVSANDGKILGVESTNFLYNHGEREIDFDSSAESAITVSDDLAVTGTRYCVIPTEWNEEVYCKEIRGTSENAEFYLYYDLSTGEEIRALVVVDADGSKLI